ncbi:MAG: mevalonate kinase [Nitrososphaeraceae archaeon]
MTTTTASAPAKIILFGEHFVVYNQPVILASINKRMKIECKIEVEKNDVVIIETNYFGKKIYPLSIIRNNNYLIENEFFYPLIYILRKILPRDVEPYSINIKIHSEIPYGVGLGSSAALSVAGVAAILGLYYRSKQKNEILDLAIETERILHKNSSGADCVVSTYGGLLYYQKNSNARALNLSKELSFIIINTGLKHSTGELVSLVDRFRKNNLLEFDNISNRVSRICERAIKALEEGNLLNIGKLMNENQILLDRIGVSTPEINNIINLSLQYGAIGSKLTGAGGGGCVLSLLHPQNKDHFVVKMKKHGYECFPVLIDNEGLKVNIESSNF